MEITETDQRRVCAARLAEFIADLIVENQRLRTENERLSRPFIDMYREAVAAGGGYANA